MLDSEELGNSEKKYEKENQLYTRIKLLGEGAFGKAYLVECNADHTKWVMKQINIADMSQEQRDQTTRQAKILQVFDHCNIVKFKQVYRTTKMKLNIVMQYADGGDLASRITDKKKHGGLFDQAQILDWFTQVCLAIKHVHDRKIIHRDIKGQNIFLTSQNIVKLGDFGIARVLHKTVEKARTVVGTPYYLSPQIIQNKPYSFASDIWSLGVVLYELCALNPPFTGNSLQFLALKIVKGVYPNINQIYSYQLKNLLKSMLATNPAKRPTIHQILNSQLLKNRIENFMTQSKKYSQFSHTILHNQDAFKPKFIPEKKKQTCQLSSPPNLIRLNQISNNSNSSENRKEQLEKISSQQFNYFNKNYNPVVQPIQKTPVISQKTPPVSHKTPINGFYRPPSSNIVRPVINQKPDLGDLLNIKSPPLNTPVVKPPLPKIVTPQISKKRPSTPHLQNNKNNTVLQIIKEVRKVEEKKIQERDFKKKTPSIQRYSDKVKNFSQQKPKKDQIIQIRQTQNVIVTPKETKIVVPKKQTKKEKNTSKVELKPIEKKKEMQPQILGLGKKVESKELKKEFKKEIKKPTKKDIKKQQPSKEPKIFELKSEEIKKLEKQQKDRIKQKSQEVRQKMRQDKKKKKREEEEKKQKQKLQNHMEQQFQEQKCEVIEQFIYPNESGVTGLTGGTSIKEQIYENEQFQAYNELQQEIILNNNILQPTPKSSKSPTKRTDLTEQAIGKKTTSQESINFDLQIPPSKDYFRMISQMQNVLNMVNNVNEAVNNLPNGQNPYKFQETLPEDRQDDTQSLFNLELSLSMTNDNKVGLDCFSDHSKLQDLRILLQEVFGLQNFIWIYRFIEKEVAEKALDFQEEQLLQLIFDGNSHIERDTAKKYLGLVITLVVLENNINAS